MSSHSLDAKADFEAVRGLGWAMAEHLAGSHRDRLKVEQRKDKRRRRLYLDVMRNAYGQTAVVPYSLRAEPGAPVATPLEWDELDRPDLGARSYDLRNVRQRLFQKDDPWRTIRQHAASAALARDRFDGLVRAFGNEAKVDCANERGTRYPECRGCPRRGWWGAAGVCARAADPDARLDAYQLAAVLSSISCSRSRMSCRSPVMSICSPRAATRWLRFISRASPESRSWVTPLKSRVTLPPALE